ncbi:hypothetical protein TNCV_3474021 [Trichonephila clavipes]|nr:hypothetical protein TNCV_3474021 [Trichonephila clavipes]
MGGRRSPKLQRQFVHLPCLQESDLKGMWGCLRSTDSMAGEAVSLHSLLPNRSCKIYRQNFEADDFPCGAVNLYKDLENALAIRDVEYPRCLDNPDQRVFDDMLRCRP